MKKYILAAALFAMFIPVSAFCGEATQTVVDFNGELIDQNAAPISGVLPLEFRIYSDKNSKKAIATEKHFVAVVDGTYAISLGESSSLKSSSDKLYVAVLLDGKELTRQEVAVQRQIVSETPKLVVTSAADFSSDENVKLECPKGYVVTGIEGNVKNLKLVCSQAVEIR